MDDKKVLLKNILESELLAPSFGELAASLGYNTTSTLYRIKKGKAGNTAITSFCNSLKKTFLLNDADLNMMGMLLSDYEYLASHLKNERANKDPQKVVVALLCKDYSLFSKAFTEEIAPHILRYQHDFPDAFYRVLFYYFVKKSAPSFYIKGESFRQQCQSFLKPLADSLSIIFPTNLSAKEFLDALGKHNQYEAVAPLLWNCIFAGGRLLAIYGSSEAYQEMLAAFTLLPGVEERAFWITDIKGQIIMTLAVEAKRKRSGFYAIFKFDFNNQPDNGSISCIGWISFNSEGAMQIHMGMERIYLRGKYTFQNRHLSLNFESDDDNPLGIGNHWSQIDPEIFPEVKKFNDGLSDMDIQNAINKGYGLENIPEYVVKDVVLSRNTVILHLESGSKLTISRDAYDFLSRIQPSDTVVVLRRISDKFEYVAWTDYNQIIPLPEFTLIK